MKFKTFYRLKQVLTLKATTLSIVAVLVFVFSFDSICSGDKKNTADNPPFVPYRESTEETVLYILPASIQGIIFALLIIAIYHD